jgi:hypothetical protein
MQLSIGVFDENGERCDLKTFRLPEGDRAAAFAYAQEVIDAIRRRVPLAMFAIVVSPEGPAKNF